MDFLDTVLERTSQVTSGLINERSNTSNPEEAVFNWSLSVKPVFPPPPSPPCANTSNPSCENLGCKVCSGCKLVFYCSQKCQSAHWKTHKRDCKDNLLSSRWKPVWKIQGYKPSFSSDGSNSSTEFKMWGSVPPVDVANLKENENDLSRDLTLAFIDSGDLRNVVKTINSLPEGHEGKVEVLVNDPDGSVATRNLALILLLGNYPDDNLAVDASLHYWVSAFVPFSYSAMQGACFYPLLKAASRLSFGNVNSSVGFGPSNTGGSHGINEWFPRFRSCQEYVIRPGVLPVSQGYPLRKSACSSTPDDRDRLYAQLAPPHRVAFRSYHQLGLALPVGAMRYHFTTANLYLFSPGNVWTPPHGADPLRGWDIKEVIAKGAEYGAQPEDIYGCLYFYLTDQLREFRRRIRDKFTIAFHVTSLPAGKLATALTHHRPSMRFDRIDVGRTLDHDKAGLKHAVQTWAPFLASQKDAAITGYCKTWVNIQPDGKAKGAGDESVRDAMKTVLTNMKSGNPVDEVLSGMGNKEGLFFSVCHNIEMGYDNSKAFATYLRDQGLNEALSHTGLKLRSARRIVPHRIGVPLQASGSALPVFESEEAWYHATMMNPFSWSERFLEFGRE